MTSSLERYLSHLRTGRRLAANTLGAYARDGALLAALSAGREPSGITSQDIRRFIAMLHGKGLSPRSLARVLSSWRDSSNGSCAGTRSRQSVRGRSCAESREDLPATLSPDEAVRLSRSTTIPTWACATTRSSSSLFERAARLELAGLDVEALDRTGEVRVTGKGSNAHRARGRAGVEGAGGVGAIRAPCTSRENALSRRSGRRVTARERSGASSAGPRRPASTPTSIRTCCGTPSPRTSFSLRATCAPSGDARPREYRLDPGLHAPGLPAPGQGLRRGPSAFAPSEAEVNFHLRRSGRRSQIGLGPAQAFQ